jgi:uncharacterized lipoprotein YmbA
MKRSLRLLICPLIVLSGCWSSSVTYYSLQPSADGARYTASDRGPIVEVRNIRFPSYLNNPQMVLRLKGAEMKVDESHRWVEDLGDNFQRVFLQDLAARLNSSAVFASGHSDQTPERVVQIEVVRFDVDTSGVANLTANYTVFSPGKAGASKSIVSVLEEPTNGRAFGKRVDTLSALVDRFAGEVAQVIAKK